MGVTGKVAKKLINYDSSESFAFKMRKKRAQRIEDLIRNCFDQFGEVKIIDVGGRKTYWNIIDKELLLRHNVHITVINLPNEPLERNDELFTFLHGDGCDMSEFKDNSFHLTHSNSVIEHVGDWSRVLSFSNEVLRVSQKHYLQTPNFWFPIEPHFVAPIIHWLPKSMRIKLVQNFDLGWYKKTKNYQEAKEIVEGNNLLTKKQLIGLFPDHSLYKEKFFGLTKSLILIKN